MIVGIGLVIGWLAGLIVLVGVGLVVGAGLHVYVIGGVLGRRSIRLQLALPPAVEYDGEYDDNGKADEAGEDDADNSGSGEALVVVVVAVGGVGGAVPPVITAVVVAGVGFAVG